jgi:hypothetical protein
MTTQWSFCSINSSGLGKDEEDGALEPCKAKVSLSGIYFTLLFNISLVFSNVSRLLSQYKTWLSLLYFLINCVF